MSQVETIAKKVCLLALSEEWVQISLDELGNIPGADRVAMQEAASFLVENDYAFWSRTVDGQASIAFTVEIERVPLDGFAVNGFARGRWSRQEEGFDLQAATQLVEAARKSPEALRLDRLGERHLVSKRSVEEAWQDEDFSDWTNFVESLMADCRLALRSSTGSGNGLSLAREWFAGADKAVREASLNEKNGLFWGVAPAGEARRDFRLGVMARLLGGIVPGTFVEEMLTVYSAGGWPCGLVDGYPHGKIEVCVR